MTFREAMRATYPVKVYQVIATALTLVVIVFGGIGGCAQYVSDQRSEQRRDTEAALYAASVASYENAAGMRADCERLVGSRGDFRLFANGIYDYFDPLHTNDQVNDLREILDQDFPERLLEDCPPVPEPPTPPEES